MPESIVDKILILQRYNMQGIVGVFYCIFCEEIISYLGDRSGRHRKPFFGLLDTAEKT
jgi:hypothetical protein